MQKIHWKNMGLNGPKIRPKMAQAFKGKLQISHPFPPEDPGNGYGLVLFKMAPKTGMEAWVFSRKETKVTCHS